MKIHAMPGLSRFTDAPTTACITMAPNRTADNDAPPQTVASPYKIYADKLGYHAGSTVKLRVTGDNIEGFLAQVRAYRKAKFIVHHIEDYLSIYLEIGIAGTRQHADWLPC